MKLSAFGQKFAGDSGIVQLMDDLGSALSENPDMIFMGGGNPGRLQQVEAVFQQRLEAIMADPEQRHALFGVYQSPQGDPAFREQLATFLSREFGWPLTAANIAISNGSQSAFFILYNMFAGVMPDGGRRTLGRPARGRRDRRPRSRGQRRRAHGERRPRGVGHLRGRTASLGTRAHR